MTRKALAAGAAALAALVPVVAAAGGGARDDTSTLAIIGDVPYGDAQVAAFPAWIEAIDAVPKVERVVHLGDIKSGGTRCTDAYFDLISDLFADFDDPLVYTPGDNEWTDCHRVSNGAYDPLERLDAIRATFFAQPGRTLGDKRKHLLAQDGYPENATWQQSGVTFAAVHVVGSNNSLAPWTGKTAPTPEQRAEAEARIAAALEWIDRAFDRAEAKRAPGVALLMQADTFEGSNETLEGFAAILEPIEERAVAFAKPVLLLQGDSHSYLVDTPIAGAPNVTRIVVEGAATASEWLELTVDPGSAAVFTWRRVGI